VRILRLISLYWTRPTSAEKQFIIQISRLSLWGQPFLLPMKAVCGKYTKKRLRPCRGEASSLERYQVLLAFLAFVLGLYLFFGIFLFGGVLFCQALFLLPLGIIHADARHLVLDGHHRMAQEHALAD